MDKTTRFTLREVYEAAATYIPGLTYKQTYNTFMSLKKSGALPKSASVNSLTWEQARMIVDRRRRPRQAPARQEAVNILRQYIRTYGLA